MIHTYIHTYLHTYTRLWPSDHRALGPSGPRTIGPSDHRALGLTDPRTNGPSDYRAYTQQYTDEEDKPGEKQAACTERQNRAVFRRPALLLRYMFVLVEKLRYRLGTGLIFLHVPL